MVAGDQALRIREGTCGLTTIELAIVAFQLSAPRPAARILPRDARTWPHPMRWAV